MTKKERVKNDNLQVINFLNAPLISPFNVYQYMRKLLVNFQTKNEHIHKYFQMFFYIHHIIIMANLSLIHYIHFKSNRLNEYSSLIVSFETMHYARINFSTPKRTHFHFQMIIAKGWQIDNFFWGWPQCKILTKSAEHQSSIWNKNSQTALFHNNEKLETQRILWDK